MDKESTVLKHDLLILEEMAADMASYLDSDAVDWVLPQANMPRLTIGGFLMRQHRLQALADRLDTEDVERLRAAIASFDEALEERIVRFEKRAHQELHTRIAEWIGCLRDFYRRARTEPNFYAGVVDTRVVIKELADRLETPPYELDAGVREEIEVIDRLLRDRLAGREFVWHPLWQDAYPPSDYWFLYGKPRAL